MSKCSLGCLYSVCEIDCMMNLQRVNEVSKAQSNKTNNLEVQTFNHCALEAINKHVWGWMCISMHISTTCYPEPLLLWWNCPLWKNTLTFHDPRYQHAILPLQFYSLLCDSAECHTVKSPDISPPFIRWRVVIATIDISIFTRQDGL